VILPCKGQNLIDNGSFEVINNCPSGYGQVNLAPNWYPTLNTPDLLHKCSTSPNFSIPQNYGGFRESIFGDAYILLGLSIIDSFIGNYEFISTVLNSPLVSGRKYCFTCWISLADTSDFAFDKFGIKVSENRINWQDLPFWVFPDAQTKPDSVLNGIQWHPIHLSFIAKGGEQYLTFGQFNHIDSLLVESVKENGAGNIGYYADNFSLVECGIIVEYFLPNVFSPNDDGINDLYTAEIAGAREVDVQIHNRWGNTVFATNDPNFEWDGTHNGKPLPAGVYFVVVHAKGFGGEQTTKTQTLHLLR
jgi:gliding motility-associated-like protein